MRNLIRVPCQPERRAELLGEDITQALDLLDRRRAEATEAHRALGQAQKRAAEADRLDAKALADAIAAGEPDPGPTHRQAADAEVAETTRLAAGHDRAASEAGLAARDVVDAADTDAIVANLNRLVADIAPEIRSLVGEIEAKLSEARQLRGIAHVLLRYDDQEPPRDRFDADTQRQAIRGLLELADVLAPTQPNR